MKVSEATFINLRHPLTFLKFHRYGRILRNDWTHQGFEMVIHVITRAQIPGQCMEEIRLSIRTVELIQAIRRYIKGKMIAFFLLFCVIISFVGNILSK